MSTFFDTSNTLREPIAIIGILILIAVIAVFAYTNVKPTLETIMAYLGY